VKNYARKHPHSMGAWTPDSKTNVATMDADDFRHNEKSVVLAGDDTLTIQLQPADGGDAVILRDGIPVLKDEIVDATVMRAARSMRSLPSRSPGRRERGRAVSRCTSRPR
jgi:isocitrate dehydrogenase